MFWQAILLVSVTKYVASQNSILSPKVSDVIENSSLELMCIVRKNPNITQWSTSYSNTTYSSLRFSIEGICKIEGFLNDTQYFETSCYSNGTHKVKIKRVTINNHDEEWYCIQGYTNDTAKIHVQVPFKVVKIENVSGNVISAEEKIKTTITCKTSVGRPAANMTWTKINKEGTKTDLTPTAVYNISKLDNGMYMSHSSIDLEPLRVENDTRIICEATNKISNVTKKEIRLHVRYSPSEPYFQYIASSEFARDGKLQHNKLIVKEGSSFTVTCRSDGDPPPTCTWNIPNEVISPNLTFTNITKAHIGLYECTAENEIQSFPKYEGKKSASKAVLDIDVQYPSRVSQFSASGKEKKKEHFEVTENETIHFVCSVKSNPVSSISLSFNEQELWRNVSKGLMYTHIVESCFDDGVYKCSAHNKYNTNPSTKELTVRVKCTPLLSPKFDLKTNITSAQNVCVSFQFKSIAYPKPTFVWYKCIDSACMTLNNDKKFKITTNGLYSSLSIEDISEDDYGLYKLRIYNTVGSLEQLYFLKANGKPDPSTLFKYLAVDITGTSIFLQWKPGFNGGPAQTFILRYKIESGSNWTKVVIPDNGDKIMNYTLSDLKSDSVYFSELFSVNSEGQSMTQNLTFKTTDFQKPTATPIHYLKLMLYCCGGVVCIVTVLVGTCFIVKRRKKRSTLKVIYQNVPPRVPDTENIYQNIPSCN